METFIDNLTDPLNLYTLVGIAALVVLLIKPELAHYRYRRALKRMPRLGPVVLWITRIAVAMSMVALVMALFT